jgi:Bacteriophage tail sheath protein
VLTALRTPGAYYEGVDAGGPEVTPLRTDIAGFVGIAERGPLDLPVPVQSWRQFVSWFGDVTAVGYLAYAVRGFFENGGVRCWVVRAASRDPVGGATPAWVMLPGSAGPTWRVRASSEGGWGNRLSLSVREVNAVQVAGPTSDPQGRFTTVLSVSGLARATHVRVSQPGHPPVVKVVSHVDVVRQRVYWVHPEGQRLPYDAPLAGLDLGQPVVVESIEYLVVVNESDRLVAAYRSLSLVPQNERYGPRVLGPTPAPVDPVTRAATWAPPQPVVIEELRTASSASPQPAPLALTVDPDARLALTGGRSGLSLLEPRDFYGEPLGPGDGPEAVAYKRRGLRALETVAEVGLVAVPDAVIHAAPLPVSAPPPPCEPDPCLDPEPEPVAAFPPVDVDLPPVFSDEQVYQIQAQLVQHCEDLRYRFALLDPPYDSALDAATGLRRVLDWRSRFDSSYAALTYPWLVVADPLVPDGTGQRVVPPCGHVGGGYAATDLDSGVHHAPANRRLSWTLAASADIDATRHGLLNDAGINAIRSVGSRGLRILGARTVCSDPDWRFVPVRRLMAMIEKALDVSLQWAVFEPNGVLTRARATMSVTIFLLGLHEAGMLAGATADESFYVRCDPDNNPASETELGRMIVEIGVAPAQPFEFVVVRVGRVHDSLEVREQGPGSATGALS